MAPDDPLAVFEAARPRLFGIAYRMMGTVAEAEDLVQETWLRWHGVDHTAVHEPAAFLATIITRLALTELDSARARREQYVGPWLPEPVDTSADPALGAERSEALSLAVLVLLERLSPAERAVYVLHEAFAYPYRRIAEMLETSETNARQLGRRARQHLDDARTASVTDAARQRMLDAFIAAAENGDLAALEAVLVDDVVALSDGGGVVHAARKPVVGRTRVARLLVGVVDKFTRGAEHRPVLVNGEAGFVTVRDGTTIAVWTVDIGPEGVRGFYNVLNPQKLSRMGEVSGHSR